MMLVKLKNFWTLSMTEAGSVFSICPSKTNSWAGRTNSRICQREQEVDGLSRLKWCVECCIFHVCGVRVPDWSGNSWASAPDGWRTSLAPDSDSGGPVVLLAHRGLRWWHHGRSTLVPLDHRELFGAVERKQKKRKFKKNYNRHCTFMWRSSHGDGKYKLRPGTRSMLCQRDWWGWWWSWLWVGELQLSEQPPQSQSSWHSSRNSSPNWCWRAEGSTPYTWHTANTNTLHKLLLLIWSHLNV